MQQFHPPGGDVVGTVDQHSSLQLVALVVVGGEHPLPTHRHVRQLQIRQEHAIQRLQPRDVTGVDDVNYPVT